MGRGTNTAKVILLIVHAFGWFGVSLTAATEEMFLNVTSEYVMPPSDVPPHMYIKATVLRAVDDKFVYVRRWVISSGDRTIRSYYQIDVSGINQNYLGLFNLVVHNGKIFSK